MSRSGAFRTDGWGDAYGFGDRLYLGPVNTQGEPVQRTKQAYPYSYDEFVVRRLLPNEGINGGAYTDRMYQWDAVKYEECRRRHLDGFRFNNAPTDRLEAFCRDYNGDQTLRLGLVVEGCNWASGYPVWYLGWATTPKSADASTLSPEAP